MIKTVLKGNEFRKYLKKHNLLDLDYMELYKCTYNYIQIFKLGDYYFTFGVMRGYTSLSSLKRLL